MHIGLFHDSVLPPKNYGGIERIMVALSRAYLRRGHRVTVFCRSGDAAKIKGEETGELSIFELPRDYQERPMAAWLPCGADQLDFLHLHQPFRVEESFRPPVPFLVTIHGNGHADEKYWRNTNFLSQSHARNHSGKYFIYNGVDPTRYPFTPQKQDYFVFLARTTWRVKNVQTAIAWANDLGVRLEIMGGSGVSRGGIHYNGLVDEPEKLRLLAGAKALIYPTNWDEPCAAAPLEALACGTPVISTPNGCMPELVRPGTGVICADYEALLSAAHQVGEVKPEACRAAVESFFSDERMADDYLSLMQKIITDGELDHDPQYNFAKSSVTFLYKPTVLNRLRFGLTGKI
ncbi:MAG: glycosyltransferase [Bdellovibrionaceae bacterium]|nr:glycosyltransferase [Pseudobdellovibrionaceae bacterium]